MGRFATAGETGIRELGVKSRLPLDVGDQGREHAVPLHDRGDLWRRCPERRHHRVDVVDVDRDGNRRAAVERHVVNNVRPAEAADRLGPLRLEPQPLVDISALWVITILDIECSF